MSAYFPATHILTQAHAVEETNWIEVLHRMRNFLMNQTSVRSARLDELIIDLGCFDGPDPSKDPLFALGVAYSGYIDPQESEYHSFNAVFRPLGEGFVVPESEKLRGRDSKAILGWAQRELELAGEENPVQGYLRARVGDPQVDGDIFTYCLDVFYLTEENKPCHII
jgi:hypothetical protein